MAVKKEVIDLLKVYHSNYNFYKNTDLELYQLFPKDITNYDEYISCIIMSQM